MKNRLFLLLTIIMLMFGTQAVSAAELGTGLAEPEAIGIPVTSAEQPSINPDRVSQAEVDSATDKWDEYASLYYYNQLSPEYRESWDALNAECKSYFDASKNVTDENGCMGRVALPDGMTMAEMSVFWKMYVYSNPQYYFIKNSYYYYYTTVDGVDYPTAIMLTMYSAFYDGADRAKETEKVEEQLATWQAEIDACATEAAKLQKMQDLICEKVTYNDDAANDRVDEQVSFSQSPYSVLCGDTTVCAGYADTFYMLCNASGIDAVSVTSSNHQWNKVRINDSWYNFDVTWDDEYMESWGYPVYRYYGRSDAMYDTDIGSGTASNITSHQEEDFWDTYLPMCTLDSSPDNTFKTPGTFAAISVQAATPEIIVSYVDGEPQVTLRCATENAVIYYTMDETNPSVAQSKSYKYCDSFASEPDVQVKAIAVCDAYLDSAVASKTIELEKYAITYVLYGGVNHENNPSTYTVKDSVTLQAPTKAGYKFGGWYLDEEYSKSVSTIAAGSTGGRTFYAKWTPITYSISYDGNGATGGSMSVQNGCEYDTAYTLASANYEREGYTFTGWNTEADGTGKKYDDEASVNNLTVADKATVILYAQWNPITYMITFEGNRETDGVMAKLADCEYDVSYTLPENNYKKTGYTFVAWNTEAAGSGTEYEDEESVKNLTTTDGTEIVLYAQWRVNTYGIAYDGNGATGGSMSVQSGCEYGTTYTLNGIAYEKTGYKFVGWNTQEEGYGDEYADEESVSNLTESDGEVITLYAQWSPVVYTICFDGNGATAGEMSVLAPCEYEKTYLLTENAYERTGYIFAGWNTQQDGTGETYANGESVSNLTVVDASTVTLYAQWSPITYTITFDGNEAESGEIVDMTGCVYDTVYTLPANIYTKNSYAFVGWNTEPDGTGIGYEDEDTIKNPVATDGATITLYAQWMMITYHIAFDGNGATSGSIDNIGDCKYDATYELSANNFVRTGYNFAGWNTAANGSGDAYADQEPVQNLTNEDNATVTLYAQWNPVSYKIVYDGNGATSGKMSAQNCKYDASQALSAVNYKKTGYKFKGWNTKADGTGKSYTDKVSVKNLAATEGAVITLYAQWSPITYTIKYDGNKATKGSMSAQTLLLYGKSYTLSANKYARTGYKFKGWNTQKDGKGTSYKNRAAVQNLSSANSAVVTLYAQWTANKYHVKFNGNGATKGSVKKLKNCSYGKKYKLPANKFKKTGYKFVGWNTKKNGKGKMYKNKAKIKNLTPKNGKTVTLYAQWKKIK